MQQMVVAVATLTKTNTQQTATIASQQKTIATLGLGLTKQSATSRKRTGTTWDPHPGYKTGDSAYYWAHGYKLRKGHTGATCKAREYLGHDDRRKATRSNNMDGCQKNKGFDN